jgi:hypothetical protein
MAFNSVQARDISIRAQVKFIEGQNALLGVRGLQGDGGYSVGCTRDRNGTFVFFLGLMDGKGKEGRWRDLRSVRRKDVYRDFFELRLTAVSDQFTVHVNGEKLLEARDSTKLRVGEPGIGTTRGRAMFKEIEVKILDK